MDMYAYSLGPNILKVFDRLFGTVENHLVLIDQENQSLFLKYD